MHSASSIKYKIIFSRNPCSRTRMKDSGLPLNLKEIGTERIEAGFSHDYYWVVDRYTAASLWSNHIRKYIRHKWKLSDESMKDSTSALRKLCPYETVFKSFSAGIIYAPYRWYFSGKSTKSIQLASRHIALLARAYSMLSLMCCIAGSLNVNLNKIYNANIFSMRKSIQKLFVDKIQI